jgi:hypothetical protein
MRENQGPRTIAQKLAEGDKVVPQPGFISAAEKAERDSRKAQERDVRRRVNFGGSLRVDEEMETGGVQRSTEPIPTTSQKLMAMATLETMSQDKPPRTIREELKSDDSETNIPYEVNEEDTRLVTDE